MTLTAPEGEAAAQDEEVLGSGKPPWWRRALDGYLYGNQFVVTVLSFIVALVVGAILIALADQATRDSLGYFFQHPTDTFSHAWTAISGAYSALFRGAVFNPDSVYSDGGTPIFGPISSTLVNAAPLILGGLAVTVAFQAGLFNKPGGASADGVETSAARAGTQPSRVEANLARAARTTAGSVVVHIGGRLALRKRP